MVVAPGNLRRRLRGDARVDLYDLDYSRLVGAPGDPVYVEHFVNDLGPSGREPVVFDGITYHPIPIETDGLERRAEGSTSRPRIRVGNADGVISELIHSVPHELEGALLIRRTVYARNLDNGPEADPRAVWDAFDVWQLEQKLQENFLQVEYELSSKPDVQGLDLPLRRVQSDLCMWTYKGPDCGWVPEVGFYVDERNVPTADPAEDECALDVTACILRFHAKQLPLRYGAFIGSARVLSS